MISKEPSHSEYYYSTVVTVVCTCETQMHHNSPHFQIQYNYNISTFEVSSTCKYTCSSHGDTTKNIPGSLGVGFAMKYCYLWWKQKLSLKYVAQPMSII